jgi:hypothetical protein
MTAFDPKEFLTRKYYATDFVVIVSDVLAFLEFSERNIDWQYRSECQTLRRRALDDDYFDHLMATLDHRFTVSLPTRVRYSAIVGLITAVDWASEFLADNAHFTLPKSPPRTNRGLHILKCYNEKTSLGRDTTLHNYANLVIVRDAIVHGSGIKRQSKENDLLSAVTLLGDGFSIEPVAWLGECVTIKRGALEPYIKEMAELLPALYKAADEKGLVAFLRRKRSRADD